MKTNSMFGIFGGVGPLASIQFVESIYKNSFTAEFEQDLPRIILLSDPSIPDRTSCLLGDREDELLTILTNKLERLMIFGVDYIIIACFTMHYLLPRLPIKIREKIVSLVSITLKEILKLKKPAILLCTKSTSLLRVFEQDPLWELANNYIIKLDRSDQEEIHKCIYQLKHNKNVDKIFNFIERLLKKYKTDCYIAGCTEFHLLSSSKVIQLNGIFCVDPLLILSRMIGASSMPILEKELV